MSDLSICVERTEEATPLKRWFDLDAHDSIDIYIFLNEEGVDPREVDITDCTGFSDYIPKTIGEACDLYYEYKRLDDPKRWPLFLEWYQDKSITVFKTVRNFKETFCGLATSPGDYFAEYSIGLGEIANDFGGMEFMDWEAYAESQKDKGYVAYICDPVTKEIGVFDPTI